MLEKNPVERITSADALNHAAFKNILSKSPLALRSVFDNKELLSYQRINQKYFKRKINMPKVPKKNFDVVPSQIKEMSPGPSRGGNKKSSVSRKSGDHSRSKFSPLRKNETSPYRDNRNKISPRRTGGSSPYRDCIISGSPISVERGGRGKKNFNNNES